MKPLNHKPTILFIDDDIDVLESTSDVLNLAGYQVKSARSGKEGLDILKTEAVDLVLLDYRLPQRDGISVLKEMMKKNPDQLVIMISGVGSIENAVEATKNGAYDFLEKPLEPPRVLLTIKNALEKTSLISEKRALLEETKSRYKMIGVSESMQNIFNLIDRVAQSNVRVLIQGESGTGKELVARAIHFNSSRVSAPYQCLNCAAIPEELVESELFGHVRGAFTNAVADKKGAFLLANNGTLLLDEIGDLSLRAQAKVLRVIEQGEVNLVGGHQVENVDVRIISATHHNLEDMIKEGTFREDLFHRINGINIHIPPLSERPDDIISLAEHFISEICISNNIIQKKLTEDAMTLLQNQKWDGNARELRNVMERAIILSNTGNISSKTVLEALYIPDLKLEPYTTADLKTARENFEKIFIINKLSANNWNVAKTAKQIGVERTHLYRKIKKLNIQEGGNDK